MIGVDDYYRKSSLDGMSSRRLLPKRRGGDFMPKYRVVPKPTCSRVNSRAYFVLVLTKMKQMKVMCQPLSACVNRRGEQKRERERERESKILAIIVLLSEKLCRAERRLSEPIEGRCLNTTRICSVRCTKVRSGLHIMVDIF